MKSAHKLALGLGVFLLLSVAAYFIVTGLQGASPSSSSSPSSRLQAAEPLTPPNESPTGRTLSSTAADEAAPPAVEPPIQKEAVAPAELEASNGFQQQSGSPLAAEPASDTSGSTPAPLVTTASPPPPPPPPRVSPDLDSLSSTTSSSTTSTTTITTPAPGPASLGTLLLESSSPALASEVPAAVTPPSSATTPDLGHAAHELADGPMTTERLYREATQRPRGQIVDLSAGELEQWAAFQQRYGRRYSSQAEHDARRQHFVGNLRFISAFNARGQAQFRLAVNHLADYAAPEINELLIGPQRNISQQQGGTPPAAGLRLVQAEPLDSQLAQEMQDASEPASAQLKPVSYRNLTGEAVDQGGCRESALFAAVAALESAINAAKSERVKLSEQQLIDCLTYNAPPPPAWPPVCQGHLSHVHLFDFIQRQGIRFSSAQEYGAFKQAQLAGQVPPNLCVLPPLSPETRYKMSSYGQVQRDSLDEALANSGPLVVALDASLPTFHFYHSGLYHEEACSPERLNYHALLVGANYSASAGAEPPASDAYTIRASLGADWGEEGHMRLLREPGLRNKCLTQLTAVYPNIGIE